MSVIRIYCFSPAARRQRTARSLEVMMHHQEHGVLSPKKMSSSSSLSSSSSSLLTLVKHSKQPVLTSLENEAVAEIEVEKGCYEYVYRKDVINMYAERLPLQGTSCS